MQNLTTTTLVEQLKAAHQTLEQTMDGVTEEVAHFQPQGTANPIAGTYAHLVFSEDLFIHQFLTKTPALMDSTFKDKTGASHVQPTDWAEAYPKWLRKVKLDVAAFRAYAAAVFSASEQHIATLTDTNLEAAVDMTAMGWGSKPTYDFIANYLNGHAYSITGEIAVLKGIQGLKGYPF